MVAVVFASGRFPDSEPVQTCHMNRDRDAPLVASTLPPVGTVHPAGMTGVTVFCMIQTTTATSPA
jgi:hypothetical protein